MTEAAEPWAIAVEGDCPALVIEHLQECAVTVEAPPDVVVIVAGDQGPPGRNGTNGANTFTWEQDTPLAVWTIPHNLTRYPSVTVVDTLGQKVEPDVSYVDDSIVKITHGQPCAGKAYIN